MSEADKLFSGSCEFIAGIQNLDQLPPASLPEIAFAGRSNVGKSSLINAITARKSLARTSHTPGRTQQLNFFNINGAFILVDMPGYGYAKVSKTQRRFWDRLINAYLRGRAPLRCTFLLIDARHGFKESDEEMMKMLDETAVPFRILLTKVDKITNAEKEQVKENVIKALKKHPAAFPEPLLCSAHK
jgi:GTP-binding protein